MKESILIVEDEFIVANDLSLILRKAGYLVCGIAATVTEAKKLIDKHSPTWVLLDIFLQDGSRGTDLADFLTAKKIGFVYISANTNQKILEIAKQTQPYGFLVKPFRENDLLIMLDIAQEKHKQNLEFELQREFMLKKQINAAIHSFSEDDQKLAEIPFGFQGVIPFDFMKLTTPSTAKTPTRDFHFMRTGFNEYQTFKNSELPESMALAKKDLQTYKPKLPEYKKAVFYNDMVFRQHIFNDPWERILTSHFTFQSKLSFPVLLNNDTYGALTFYSRKTDGYSSANLAVLQNSEALIKTFLEQFSTTDAIDRIPGSQPAKLTVAPAAFDGIVGNSPELLKVLDNIALVSQSEISVLITGESGTGKEKVAQNIHKLSNRKNKPMVVVNCAALPHELIESELFGHVRGAFTGAIEKRTGKFELANGGTIFLDEIGELPLDAQVKLLRVLQEKEIDHIGGRQPVKIDVRVIAATNRKLEKEVAEGRFRLDLYYRLNVYPIDLPPLNARKQDIPLLAAHFLQVFAKDTGKQISGFSSKALGQMQSYNWPGNIRELAHLIQRSMILATGPTITQIPLPEMTRAEKIAQKDIELKTLEQVEMEHILGILKNCNGKVCGPGGAAEILGLPPSTLNSKIKKLGIKRESYFNYS